MLRVHSTSSARFALALSHPSRPVPGPPSLNGACSGIMLATSNGGAAAAAKIPPLKQHHSYHTIAVSSSRCRFSFRNPQFPHYSKLDSSFGCMSSTSLKGISKFLTCRSYHHSLPPVSYIKSNSFLRSYSSRADAVMSGKQKFSSRNPGLLLFRER